MQNQASHYFKKRTTDEVTGLPPQMMVKSFS